MDIQKVTFVNIRYSEAERDDADKLAFKYEKRGYTREADNQGYAGDWTIQLMTSSTKLASKTP